jgi:hypothetical protein
MSDLPICPETGDDVDDCDCADRCEMCGQSEAGCACYDEQDEADDIYQVDLDERD